MPGRAHSTILAAMDVFLASVLIGYVCGSIPTAVWVTRRVGGFDIRKRGSGNAGATNVARVVGVHWGILVGVIDILKGFLPVLLLSGAAGAGFGISAANAGLLIGIAAILGHMFPLFAGFKGGKGVLTALGVFGALLPLEAGLGALVWVIVFATTRIVSLGSIVACLAFVAAVLSRRYLFDAPHPTTVVVAVLLVTALVIYMHRSNIVRLLRGEEKKFGAPR
ncbi:MAG TPA: glycerol-3-phosphate 1-O-acyltransferase PlsY [bacterium]|nr:glycerol-3-phosphate 1-O-acyltransferase PlsY [bacterium]